MGLRANVTRVSGAFSLAGTLLASLASPAGATDRVTLTVVPGPLSVSVTRLPPITVDEAHSARHQTGMVMLIADDSTGSGDGWQVTLQSSDWMHRGPDSGSDIPARDVAIASVSVVTPMAGQPVDATGGPKPPVSVAPGTLDVARTVLQANQNFGQGTYLQRVDISFRLPAPPRAGSYVGTLTVSISAGP